jgi:hypothetical protein
MEKSGLDEAVSTMLFCWGIGSCVLSSSLLHEAKMKELAAKSSIMAMVRLLSIVFMIFFLFGFNKETTVGKKYYSRIKKKVAVQFGSVLSRLFTCFLK